MSDLRYRPGDWVIYRMTKHSASPGRRAREIRPEPHGEEYWYCVDKFWMVTGEHGGRISLITRRGKQRFVDPEDINLRHARWWERVIYRDRFPQVSAVSMMRPIG